MGFSEWVGPIATKIPVGWGDGPVRWSIAFGLPTVFQEQEPLIEKTLLVNKLKELKARSEIEKAKLKCRLL